MFERVFKFGLFCLPGEVEKYKNSLSCQFLSDKNLVFAARSAYLKINTKNKLFTSVALKLSAAAH
jgi:hypothetical protein